MGRCYLEEDVERIVAAHVAAAPAEVVGKVQAFLSGAADASNGLAERTRTSSAGLGDLKACDDLRAALAPTDQS